MKKHQEIFIRRGTDLIKNKPDTWQLPCSLPRDNQEGFWLPVSEITRVDDVLGTIEWKGSFEDILDARNWSHFTEIYCVDGTNILGKFYRGNMEEVKQ